MNESAPAPQPQTVPWWERVAAGVLAVGWLFYVFWLDRVWGWKAWWGDIHVSWANLSGYLGYLTQFRGTAGSSPDASSFLMIAGAGGHIYFALGIPLLFVAALGIAASQGTPKMRLLFWLSVLVHGFVALAALASFGRRWQLHLLTFPGPQSSSWHGGWLGFLNPDSGISNRNLIPAGVELLLAALVLGIGWWLRRWRNAGTVE